MPELTLHYPDGRTETRRVESGTRLLDAVEPAYRTAPCGGNGRCGKCRVQATGCLSEPQEQEKSLLGDDLLRGWRLACLTRVAGDAEVTLHQTAQLREICADGELPPFVRQPLFTRYGAAVDIGTTTLAAQLYDHDGRRLAQAVAANPQAVFGADVISRIEKSLAGEREALMRCIRRGIDGLLAELSASAGVSPSDIDAVVVTGNTTMLYLLTGRSVDCLARAPFAADELFGRWAQAGEVELASVPSPRGGFPRRIFLEYKQRERRRTGIVAHRRRLFMPSFGYFDRKMRNNLVTYPCRTALTFARLADTIKKKWKRYR